MGRKPKLTAHQQRSARSRLAQGESTGDVAREFNVHHATIARLRYQLMHPSSSGIPKAA